MMRWEQASTLALILAFGALAQEAPKKVGQSEAMAAVVTKVQPEYPAIAKQLRISGAVELEVDVAETGAVEKVTIISGNAMLTGAALDAVKRWKFRPFTEGGKPIKVIVPLTINFKY